MFYPGHAELSSATNDRNYMKLWKSKSILFLYTASFNLDGDLYRDVSFVFIIDITKVYRLFGDIIQLFLTADSNSSTDS